MSPPKPKAVFSLSHPVLGAISPDPVGNMLGTGFARFEGKHFAGLFRSADQCVDILAIVARKEPGSGQFPLFLNELKARYDTIRFYEIWNPLLLKTLVAKHGFKPFEEYGVEGPNLIWEKP